MVTMPTPEKVLLSPADVVIGVVLLFLFLCACKKHRRKRHRGPVSATQNIT